MKNHNFNHFLVILDSIRIEFGQILVQYTKNRSKLFLAQLGRLGSSSRLFYDFIQMAIERDMLILGSLCSDGQSSHTQKSDKKSSSYLVFEYFQYVGKRKWA